MNANDIVRLTENVRVSTDRGVLRHYGAGEQFRVKGLESEGQASVTAHDGLRVTLPVALLEVVKAARTLVVS